MTNMEADIAPVLHGSYIEHVSVVCRSFDSSTPSSINSSQRLYIISNRANLDLVSPQHYLTVNFTWFQNKLNKRSKIRSIEFFQNLN